MTSSATQAGLEQLKLEIFKQVQPLEPQRPGDDGEVEQMAEHAIYRPSGNDSFEVAPSGEHIYRISGPAIERLIARHDLSNEDALAFIEERLRAIGVIAALEAKGFAPGDEIEIGEVAFALYPGVPQGG